MKYLFSLSFILIAFNLSAQKAELEGVFNSYIEATKSNDVSEQLDYFYPAMFEYFPREDMIDGLKQTKQNGMIELDNERLEYLSEILEKDDNKYALLTYKVDLSLNVSELMGKEGSEEAIAKMTTDYQTKHGEENVNFDEETYVFTITFTNNLYAIFDNELGSWKFIPKEDTTTMVSEQVIPEGIRAKLNS